MNSKCALVAAIITLWGMHSATAADFEKPTALNGRDYAVIAPVYTGGATALSYIRLFNGGTAAANFNITVVNADNGFTLGVGNVAVPAKASVQYPLTGSTPSISTIAGVAFSAGVNYAVYVLNVEPLSGYQHVTYNPTTALFENNSVCPTAINQQFAATNRQVLTNVHTSIMGSNYPSVLLLHNYAPSATTITLAVYDSATGNSVGQVNRTIAANSTAALTVSELEALINFRPSSSQYHLNIIVSNAAGGELPVRVTQSIRNAQVGGDINMSGACAVNPVAPTVVQVAATVPTAYCGTFRYPSSVPFPYNVINFSFIVSVAPNGRLRGAAYGQYTADYYEGETLVGSVVGTNWSAVSSDGIAVTGTVQNGTLTGSGLSAYGTITFTGTTSGCS